MARRLTVREEVKLQRHLESGDEGAAREYLESIGFSADEAQQHVGHKAGSREIGRGPVAKIGRGVTAPLRGIPGIGGIVDEATTFALEPGREDLIKSAAAEAMARGRTEELKGQIPGMEDLRVQPFIAGAPQPILQTAFEDAQADPESIAAQRRALQGLTDIVDQGGLTAVDRARIAEAREQEGQFLRGAREATLANLEARGMRGSGADLMAQLASQQEAGQRLSRANLATEAQAQMRAMQALGMLGGQAGQMRGQSYGEAQNQARAQDALNIHNQGMLEDWKRYQAGELTNAAYDARDQQWKRYGAQAGIHGIQTGEDRRRSEQAQDRAAQERGQRDALVGAGLKYLTGGAGAPPGAQQQGGADYDPDPFGDPNDKGFRWG